MITNKTTQRRAQYYSLVTCLKNLAIAANELHECLEQIWQIRAENLKANGIHNLNPVMDSIRTEVLGICKDSVYSGPMLSAIQGVIDGFRPKKPEANKVPSISK